MDAPITFPMAGRTILVTGATDGIGQQTAIDLARLGASVLLHGRDAGRVRQSCDLVASATGSMPQPFVADLSSLAQIRRLAAEVHSRTASLHGIVQNAGVFVRDRRVSDDGLELTFAVNHLAPFLLTHLLLGLLRESAPARVVVVSSVAHHRGHIDFDDLQRERSYDGYGAYAGSKLANMLFAFELADRLEGTRVTSNALHPGTVGTKLLREGFAIGGVSVAEGAATPVFVASDRSLCEVTGKYFVDRHPARPASATADRILRARLWDVSAAMTGAA